MAENGGISADEFTRLQTQLIELRTENYEIAEKYRKTREENSVLQDKVESKEREVQRVGKLMKIPGLQAFTKNKGKRSHDEIVEENERLIQQMQRHEEDFNLQNKTLLEEISRLSVERDEYENELKKLKDTRTRQLDENDELLKIKAENTVLHKKLQDYESRHVVDGKIDKENTNTDLAEGEDKEISSIGDEEDGDSSIKQIVEATYLEFRKKNNKLEDVNEGEEVEGFDEKERNFMETLIAKLKTLATKAQVKPESSRLGNEVAVKLETEEAENRLLRDQIKDEREKTRIEIETLKAEVEKLTEKTKRKQESYLQLQEEKETLHKEKSRLEEEWIKTKELLAKSEDTKVELQGQVEIISKENDEIKIEISSLREKLEHCSPDRVSELEQTLRGKHEELTSLKAQIEESSSLNQDMMLEVQKLSEEKAKIENDASQNQELASKRKKLLDELSVERQHELSTHKKELEDSKNENEEQKKKLELIMSDLERAKREVTLTNDRHSELLKNYSSLEKKAGWLERTLKESEEQLETNKRTHEDSIVLKEKEFAEKLSAVDEEHQAEIEALNGEKAEVEKERDQKVSIIEKMNQTAKDKEVEFRISGKKSEQLLKDLKRQLKTERKRSDQIQQRLQDFLSESKTKQTFDEIFKSDPSLQKGHRRQDSGSHLSTVSSGSGLELSIDNDANKTSTPLSGTPLSGGSESIKLTNETVELISKVADLQLEKNVLEEKVRFLEENSSVMVDDLMRKSEIIQNYVRDTKPDMLSDTAKKKNMTLKEKMKDSLSIGKHGKSEDMLKEMNAKMQRWLEETLEKNIQLEKDVDHLTKELENASKSASS